MSKAKDKPLRALTGLDYRHADTGKYVRVEAGEIVEGLNEVARKNELDAGNIEEVEIVENEGEN